MSRTRHPGHRMAPRCATRIMGAVALLALSPVTARADGDAGIRSVFAYGAGNRALALGGAYAGLADDASAALWNPGGLGFVPRRTFDASYASLYGLGFQEHYAALALPSWRFGTFALTYQQFGVDGIDRRDENNFVLGEDESDSQTQITFGYGRPFGPAWSLGTALKLRRQSLAGYSDTGFGLDAGVLLRPALAFGVRDSWAERISFGLAVQNIVPPSLRLQESSVEDPPAARAGVSFWVPFGRTHLLWVADLEKTDGMDMHAHAGMEARVYSALSLRLGINDRQLATGGGIVWRDLSFDYVYESNNIEPVHRFGAAFRFGLSVDESRQAALAAQEAALAARLADEFRRRQAAQVEELLRQAETQQHEGDLDAALERVTTVRVLAPEDERARRLEAELLAARAAQLEAHAAYADAVLVWRQVLDLAPGDAKAQAGQARCQSLSDQRAARSQQIRREFARAMEAFSSETFVVARQGFGRVLELNPGDNEAYEMLARTEKAIARRAQSSLQLAARLLDDGVLDEAARQIELARALDPHAEGLDLLSDRLRTASRVQAQPHATATATGVSEDTSVPRPAPVPVLSPERKKEIDELYRRGGAAMQEGRSVDAVRYWELVWAFDPHYERVREHLKREYMTMGLEHFARGALDAAIEQWQKALRVDPTDERALAYLQRAQEQRSRTRQILGQGN